jgi:hypothetical protein
MDDIVIKAVSYSFVTEGVQDEDGTWKVVCTTTERMQRVDTGEWIEEKADAMVMHKELQPAIDIATKSVMKFMLENVYQAGFESLIDYYEYQRQKKELKADANKT